MLNQPLMACFTHAVRTEPLRIATAPLEKVPAHMLKHEIDKTSRHRFIARTAEFAADAPGRKFRRHAGIHALRR